MSELKPIVFSEQLRYCTENEMAVHENCHACGKTLSMCIPFGGQCRSSKCKKYRARGHMILGTKLGDTSDE